ncbi:MAG: YraN family protein [Herpetosiphonaceae bacterium]|nr:YraN family protein [Herpetosiphonaceae bacterium]
MTNGLPQPDARRSLGAWGERLAADHLEAAGYRIVTQGWRCRLGELDIIATHGATLVLVEVRTRRGTARGSAEESITPAKARRLALLALAYLNAREQAGDGWAGPYRIDVVAITLDASGYVQTLNHIESAIGE